MCVNRLSFFVLSQNVRQRKGRGWLRFVSPWPIFLQYSNETKFISQSSVTVLWQRSIFCTSRRFILVLFVFRDCGPFANDDWVEDKKRQIWDYTNDWHQSPWANIGRQEPEHLKSKRQCLVASKDHNWLLNRQSKAKKSSRDPVEQQKHDMHDRGVSNDNENIHRHNVIKLLLYLRSAHFRPRREKE